MTSNFLIDVELRRIYCSVLKYGVVIITKPFLSILSRLLLVPMIQAGSFRI